MTAALAAEAKRPPPLGKVASSRLPQQPRVRDEYIASSKLAGVGASIAKGAAQRSSSERPARAQNLGAGARRPTDPGTGETSAATSRHGTPGPSGRANSPPPTSAPAEARYGGWREERGPPQQANYEFGLSKAEQHQPPPLQQGPIDPMEIAKGGDALLRRLADVGQANRDLRRQLDQQAQEVLTLEEVGRSQQQLLQEFRMQQEQKQQREAMELETRLRGEAATNEARWRAELDALKEQAAQREQALRDQVANAEKGAREQASEVERGVRAQAHQEREELMNRLRQNEGELLQCQGERDELRARVADLEAKLEMARIAPDALEMRLSALDMELNLVRTRLVREKELRDGAEKAAAESQMQLRGLQAALQNSKQQARHAQRGLEEQRDLASFREEIIEDLSSQLKDQQADASERLRKEKGRYEAVNRLEGILPRQVLMQALH